MWLIPVAVVAHNTREKRAERLADFVNAEFLTLDDGSLGPGRNHVVAWEWLAEGDSQWSVVLEDDAMPVKGFQEQLAAMLKRAPDPVVSLYLGRGRPRHWQPSIQQVITRPEHFLRAPELLHHVGVAVRNTHLSSMLAFLGHQNLRRVPIDEAVGRWVRHRRIMVSYCNPSIVDHDANIPTSILTHTSTHAAETGRRDDPREVRKAWQHGTRVLWTSQAALIPIPRL